MATTQQIHEHDVVQLRRQIGSWPVGREGTVVAEKNGWKLIEIADEEGATLDFLPVADSDLDVLWRPSPS